MKFTWFIFFSCCYVSLSAQQYQRTIDELLGQNHRGVEHLMTFEELGIKHPGSMEILNTRNWLVNEYVQAGFNEVWLDSFIALSQMQYNVIAKKQGISNDFIVIGSHYDTKSGPGVNDNGTGVSATLVAAAKLVNYTPLRTLYFVNFSGEESGFHGSQHFVDSVVPKLAGQLYLMINLDQLGGTLGFTGNEKIYCERDEMINRQDNNAASARITDTIARLAELYTNLTPVVSSAFSSDYVPFENQGYTITGLYQYSDCPYIHTLEDSFFRIDTNSFAQAVRLSTSAIIHYAQIQEFSKVDQLELPEITTSFSGDGVLIISLKNAADPNWNLKINDLSGREISAQHLERETTYIDLHSQQGKVLIIHLSHQSTGKSMVKKLMLP